MKLTKLAVMGLAIATSIQPALAQIAGDTQSIAPNRAETSLDEPTAAPAPDPTPAGGSATGGEWHFSASPYLWFPGIYGTVGARGRDAGVHVGAIDLLSHLRFGLMGAVEARRGPFVLPLDIVWARLRDDKAIPAANLLATTANVKAGLLILTPKVGIRVLNEEKIKFDVLAGFRYWHLGENLKFSPSLLNLNFKRSQDLVDPVVGGRIEAALSPKFVVNILGDVGGWDTGSKLEYQVAGLIGYKIKESATLQAGYRYLDLNYRRGGTNPAIFNVNLTGVLFGVTFNLK
jgi:hypothetical protein